MAFNFDFDAPTFWASDAARKVVEHTEAEAPLTVTDCPLTALQIAAHEQRHAVHRVQVLRAAYGLEAEICGR
jgi:hypothetical protein